MYEIDDTQSAIREVQRFLLELHYYTNAIPHVAIDGIYGDATRAGVRAYQRLRNLPETGVVDYTTWKKLYGDYKQAVRQRESEKAIPPDTPLPASIGASGVGIRTLQELLNALAARYAIGIRTDTLGVYSYATAALANALRRIYRLPEDGTVNGEFFEKLLRDYAHPTPRG